MGVVDISRKDKAEVLCALYNASRRFNSLRTDDILTKSEAQVLLKTTTSFEFVKSHIMRIDLTTNTVDTTRFNHANGPLAAENAIEKVSDIYSYNI